MVLRRNVLTLASLLIVALVLFHFQNCAPAAKLQASEASGGVRIVDDFNKAQLQFVSADTEVLEAAAQVDIMGLCTRDHNGARLRWAIWTTDVNSFPLLTGESFCHAGQFSFAVPDLDKVDCGVKHAIVVAGDWGDSSLAHIARRCPSAARQELAASDGAPFGTSCALEYSPQSLTVPVCAQVCYRAGIVVSSHAEDATRCAALAESLAGQ